MLQYRTLVYLTLPGYSIRLTSSALVQAMAHVPEHQVECDPTLLALGGSRITFFGARNNYTLVNEERDKTMGVKLITRTWQPKASVVQDAAQGKQIEFELVIKAKGKKYRLFFRDMEGAHSLHLAWQEGWWNPETLEPL